MYVIMRLKFEFVFFDVKLLYIGHYASKITPNMISEPAGAVEYSECFTTEA